MPNTNRAALPFVTVSPSEPLRLVSTFFRSGDSDRPRPGGWLDLLVMQLTAESAGRLVRAYDYAFEIRAELYRRDIIQKGDGSEPRIEVPVAIPVSLHSSACADGSGWDLVDADPWSALPVAFPNELLGSPNPDCSEELLLQPVLQLHRHNDIVHLRICTNICNRHLPEFFQTEELPIDELREWHLHRRWPGAVILRDDVNYAGH